MPKKEPTKFPDVAERIIETCCREDLCEEIVGNLCEYHDQIYRQSTSRFTTIRFWWEVLSYIRLSTIKKNQNSKFKYMFFFNPKLAIRSLIRQKMQTTLNLAGFTLGIMCVTVLYFYVTRELSYDQHHINKDNMYRVLRMSELNGDAYDIGVTSGPFGPALLEDFPGQIETMTRFAPRQRLVRFEDNIYREEHFAYADANFFEFFTVPLIVGEAGSVLENANSIVISKDMAIKYFGNENPLGKVLTVDNKQHFQVTGIFDQPSGPSHIKFDMVASIAIYKNANFMKKWWWNSLYTYVSLVNPDNAEALNQQFPAFMDKYFAEDFKSTSSRIDLKLEPVDQVYFNTNTRYDHALHGNRHTVYTLGIVAIAILLIACFNYLNLSLASALTRTREIGIRKVLGSDNRRLIVQFIGESFILLIFGIILAIMLTQLLMPAFNQWFGLDIELSWLDPKVFIFFMVLTLLIILLSSLYPAVILSSFTPIESIREGAVNLGKGLLLRKALVVAQFVVSIFMIISTWIINSQLDYINKKELGFDRESVILLELNNSELIERSALLKEQLLRNANIGSVTNMSGEPGGFHDATTINISGHTLQPRVRTLTCDFDYFNTFKIKMKSGRIFDREYPTDMTHTALINESALKDIGLSTEEIFSRKVHIPMIDSVQRSIIGIVEDYHFASLKDKIEPMIIIPHEDNRKMAIKVNERNLRAGIQTIHETWDKVYPEYPFIYTLHEDKLASLYQDETTQQAVFSSFALVSIFLACLGIFGLVAHAATRRRKEFGIRKVLGANVKQLLALISREFIILISIAFLISVPISAYFIDQWLTQFVYKIDLTGTWPTYLLSGVIALTIALLTVFIRTFRTAMSNPTDCLRYE